MTKTIDITEELKNKIYSSLAQNLSRYDNGVIADVEHSYYVSNFLEKIKHVQLYAERIKEFEEKAKLVKGLEEQVQTYKEAITLLQGLVIDSFKDNIESSKAKYERDKDIYRSHNYIELPVSLLGYKSNDKVVYSLYYSNINSLENNKKYLFSKIKDNDYLRNEYIKLYFPNIQGCNLQGWSVEHQEQYINEVCKEDMYFETFFNSKDRTNFVKENTEITHLAISCKNSRVQTKENTYIVLGNFNEKEVLKRNVLINNNEKILELLNS